MVKQDENKYEAKSKQLKSDTKTMNRNNCYI